MSCLKKVLGGLHCSLLISKGVYRKAEKGFFIKSVVIGQEVVYLSQKKVNLG